MHSTAARALAVLAIVATPAAAHSWVEQLMVIGSDGQFKGTPGYARNNTMRTAPGFSDPVMVHILPGQGQPAIEQRDGKAPVPASPEDIQGVQASDAMCKKTQQAQYQSNGSPRLKAAAGDMVALRYEENGHVTLPKNQPGKPDNRGNVYIYGTTQPKSDEKFLDIYGKWNTDGTGGDKRGKLLATQPFDDGQCYQVNGGSISADRQKQYPHSAGQLMGTDLWCQNDIKIPTDAQSGKPYTLYWVWDWPTIPGVDPGLPKGKAEIYTSCMDIDITGTKASRDLEERQAPAPSGGNIANMAIPKYLKQLAVAPVQPAQPAASASQPTAAPVTPSSAAAAAPVASSPAAAPAAPAPAGPAPAGGAAEKVTVTVTVATPAQAPATQAPAASANTMASQAPAAQAPASLAPAASPAVAQSATNAMPPSRANLNIAAPVLSAGSGAPAASPATFSGTASNVAPSTMLTAPSSAKTQSAAVGARSCPANRCQQKRSKIFGSAVH